MVSVIVPALLFMLMVYPIGVLAEKLLRQKSKGHVRTWIFGGVCTLAYFQLISVPMILLNVPTAVLAWIMLISCLAAGVAGMVILWREREMRKPQLHVLLLLLVILAFGQAYASASLTHYDSDDAEVVSLVTDAVQNGHMLRHQRESGRNVKVFSNIKRVASPYQMLEAGISIVTGLHPAIVCHTLMPFLLIPFCYGAVFCLGSALFPDSLWKSGLFVLFVDLIYLMSSYSSHNAGYFFLVRTWQGKSMLQALILPVLLFMTLEVMRYPGERKYWVRLLLGVTAACVFTNLSFIAGLVVVGAGAIGCALKERRLSPVLYGCLTVLPCLLYGGLLAYGVYVV